ncbi:MAG: AAA family ATPase [Candidatus Villigracilaceae bacterium]
MTSKDWDTLIEKQFVQRPQAEEKITQWVEASSERPLLSVVAPPGNGKSWILRNLYNKWGKSGDRLVIWLDAPRLINRNEQNPAQMIQAETFLEWFREIKERANQHCGGLETISEIVDFSAQIETLVDKLCNHCNLKQAPVLIVDGYDEMSEQQAETLNLRILQPFLARPCTRLLLAHRVEWKAQGLLSYKRQVLFLSEEDLSPKFAQEQFKRLFAETHPGAKTPDPTGWMSKLRHYRWNHPFINRFLFERGLGGDASSFRALTEQDFYDCCQAVVERPDAPGGPRYSRLTKEEFTVLHQLATRLPETWAETDCTKLLGISSMISDSRLMRLFEAGLISNLPSTQAKLSSPLYQVNNGIRELLKEISDLNEIQF